MNHLPLVDENIRAHRARQLYNKKQKEKRGEEGQKGEGEGLYFFYSSSNRQGIKLISYWYGVPQSILAWEYRRLYA